MFSNPLENLKTFELRDNMVLVDLGAGTGFYSIHSAELLPHGKVYAVEINRDFLKTVRNKAKDLSLSNLECFCGDVEKKYGTKLNDNIADRIIASNILFQVEDKEGFIKEANRILKEGGKLMLIDHDEGSLLLKKHRQHIVPKEKAKELLENEGFSWERDIFAGNHNYGMIFIKNKKEDKSYG